MSENKKEKKEKSGGNLFKVIIVVFLGLILAGGAGFGGYMLGFKKAPSTSSTASVEKTSIVETYFDAGEFTVNLADKDEDKHLQVTINLAYDSTNKKLPDELTSKTPAIKDAIISTIRQKTKDQLQGQGSDALKKDIITSINSLLSKGIVTSVSFTSFIID
ncbi:flagellar basal body-associated FliL family protein [Clostridium sp. 19966]|uniref:flagellar basal body-associated FliL family protein n=1 Tax=Clostridium sp. 19966 TaxID=2768166 RepID=UPI0028DDC447|nr:flagellar basal body-associated FliL family protein [Clostridium sp. 19966]MDT8716647.1 flagellar basal body-associated FliL family protein [Clostridium sp. 19966]